MYTLDGDRVKDADDLEDKGGYVLVYKDRPKFDDRDFYYLPDGVKDTR